MPSAGLSLIEQYRFLAKGLEQQNCDELLAFDDQEVPQTRSGCDEAMEQKPIDIKSEPGYIQDDLYSLLIFDSLMACGGDSNNNDNSSSNNSNSNNTCFSDSNTAINGSSPSDLMRISKDFHYGSNTSLNNSSVSFSSNCSSQQMSTSCHSSSPFLSSTAVSSNLSFPSSLLSSNPNLSSLSQQSTFRSLTPSPNPVPVSSLNIPTVISSPTSKFSSSQPKVSSYVTELGGSGGTMTSFLYDQVPSEPLEDTNALDITDLDKQPFSFYDELEPFRFNEAVKPVSVQNVIPDAVNSDLISADDSSLAEMVLTMRNDLLSVSESLNIPYDPESWNPEQAKLWVSWVCRKHNVPDISRQVHPLNGRDLCTHPSLLAYGESGRKISEELEFLKAAYSTFPTPTFQNNSMLPPKQTPQNIHMGYTMQPKYSPCVSPAPSTGSNSQDSTLSASSNSDDEMIGNFVGRVKVERKYPTNKVPGRPGPGRGHHKQTIHLWQFLRELLVSQEDHSDCIRWLDRKAGIFKIEDSKKVAGLWGRRKNRPAMNYDKLSRSVRQYYKKGIIKKTDQSKRLVYQFCEGYL